MKRENLLIILDESGSMGSTRLETIQSLTSLLNELKVKSQEDDLNIKVTLTTFNHLVTQQVTHTKLSEIDFDNVLSNYNPEGLTALYDAVGQSVTFLKTKKPNPTKVIILTDGHENASKEYNQSKIAELLKDVQDNLGWTISFLGANILDINTYVQSLNIKADNSFSFKDVGGARGSVMAASLSTMYGFDPNSVTVDTSLVESLTRNN